MLSLIKDVIRPIYNFSSSRNYRCYTSLFSTYQKFPRFTKTDIHFLDYTITVPDALSFIYQYKEIFLDQSYLFRPLRENPVIYDCGANIGVSCLYFKQLFPSSIIKAFEADPEVFKVLQRNLTRNVSNGPPVLVTNAAIWTDDKGVAFSSDGADGGSIVVEEQHNVRVPSIRLKALLETEPYIDLLKLDIEGAEAAVLRDCSGSLGNVNRVFFEYHSFVKHPQVLHDILKIMAANGFRYFIQSVQSVKSPFIGNRTSGEMDLQLNVYCEKLK